VIDPQQEAEALLTVREQLAKECVLDLKLVTKENERLQLSYQQKDVLQNNMSSVWHNPSILPVFREEGETVEGNTDDKTAVFESSPFRQLTWDLLLRLMTKIAALDVLAALSASSDEEAQYQWFKGVVGEALPTFEGNSAPQVDKAFIKDLMRRTPSVTISADGGPGQLVDPHRAAGAVLERRAQIAAEWAQVLTAIPDDHRALRRSEQSPPKGRAG